MSDLIDRQAAIDKAYTIDLSDTGNDIELLVVDVHEIEKLPSAQPVTCRKCARWNTVLNRNIAEYGLCQIRSQLEATRCDDFCSRAERRTDG